ncbi:MAG: Crp/Fnr family transcriptional regulator [Amphritea sp.]
MKTLDSTEVIDSLGMPYLHDLSTLGALSDEVVIDLLQNGHVRQVEKGEVLCQYGMEVTGFSVVLKGDIAFYKHCEGKDVLTRHFTKGEQIGFDVMLAMKPYSGTEVAHEQSLVLQISSGQFFDLHVDYPADFGLFMINLGRELSREISILEDVIGKSSGWIIDE